MSDNRQFGRRPVPPRLAVGLLILIVGSRQLCLLRLAASAEPPAARAVDPARWGSDHVGKPVPEYVTGDECLFCHRNDIGPKWPANRHQLTMRPAEPLSPEVAALRMSESAGEFAEQVHFILGGSGRGRFLRKTPQYGKLDLLSIAWRFEGNGDVVRLANPDQPQWDSRTFGTSCAGCHATGVDSLQKTFSAVSLDCFVCHGDVSLEHTNKQDAAHVVFSKGGADDSRVVVSACAQCHIRTGKSRSTGLPYPNNFVAGDNLLRDFKFDWSAAALERLNPVDRHIHENVRDVAVEGRSEMTCLSCHNIHRQSHESHQQLPDAAICANCHFPAKAKSLVREYAVHSVLCNY